MGFETLKLNQNGCSQVITVPLQLGSKWRGSKVHCMIRISAHKLGQTNASLRAPREIEGDELLQDALHQAIQARPGKLFVPFTHFTFSFRRKGNPKMILHLGQREP